MNITVYGGTNAKMYYTWQIEECEKLGKWLGEHNCTVLTGACAGFPYFVGKKAIEYGSKVIGYTPAKDLREHIEVYHFPTDGITDLEYAKTPSKTMSESFLRRSLEMIPFSDVAIMLGGSWGTFSELVMSFMCKKTIIMVEEFRGAVEAFEMAYDYFSRRDFNPAVHEGSKIILVKTVDECIAEVAKLM